MKWIYKLLSIMGDAKAASRGPGPFVKRYVRKKAHLGLSRLLRKILK